MHLFTLQPQLAYLPQKKKPQRPSVSWVPPPSGTWKINVDGSSQGKPGPAGIGGQLRDHSGVVHMLFSKNVGEIDFNLAELLAVVEALSIVVNANFFPIPNIIVESDSKAMISWINKESDRPWKYNNILNKLSNFLLRLGNVVFVHAFREVNTFADFLAKSGIHRYPDLVVWL